MVLPKIISASTNSQYLLAKAGFWTYYEVDNSPLLDPALSALWYPLAIILLFTLTYC